MKVQKRHCVKNVRIRSFSGPYFPAFGVNTSVSLYSFRMRENTDCIRKTPNTDTFHAVRKSLKRSEVFKKINVDYYFLISVPTKVLQSVYESILKLVMRYIFQSWI